MNDRFSIILLCIAVLSGCAWIGAPVVLAETETLIELPQAQWQGDVSVEAALRNRRSIRTFKPDSLTLAEVSQLLWSAQGIRVADFRTAPSAGALYPLEVHVVAGNVEGLDAGVYRYNPSAHGLAEVVGGDMRGPLAAAAWWQNWMGNAAIALVISAVYERTTKKYGERGIRYVHMEAGHAAQNVYLQAQSLGLGTVVVGAFRDNRVRNILRLREDEQPLSIMPVGKPLD